MKRSLLLIICLTLFIASCGPKDIPADFIIVPDQCRILTGEEFPISLRGTNIPSDGVITWSATKGEVNPPTGYTVTYIAPQEPGTVRITAVLEANGKQSSAGGLTCEILSPATDVPQVSSPTPEPPTQEPTQKPTKEPTQGPTLEPTLSIPPTTSGVAGETIAITEVMPYPCGYTNSLPSINEYIELYNYGATDVDVRGWWIGTTGGGQGTPDQLVAWNTVNPKVNLGNNLKLNDTVIPPGGFAVVLSPVYHTGLGKYKMPYAFPQGTTILTFTTSEYVGNDSKGLAASYYPLTTIVLYIGTEDVISTVVSTYGTPYYGSVPDNIADNKADNFPYFISQCHAMERIDASKPDALDNWHEINEGKPGSGNYK
ncbi:MAG: lamin tail domain-containing protein [Anaerolineales bacterium]